LEALRRFMIVRYSARNQRPRSIREYLSKPSPLGAVNVLTAIYAAVEFIRKHPEATQGTRIVGVRAKLVQTISFQDFLSGDRERRRS
jgi:hypothetical protein